MLIEVDVPSSVVQARAGSVLARASGFGWQGHYQAANYCAMKGVNLEEATTWADQSIQANRNFSNLWVKGLLQEKSGPISRGQKDQGGKRFHLPTRRRSTPSAISICRVGASRRR